MNTRARTTLALAAWLAALVCADAVWAEQPFAASAQAVDLDRQMAWGRGQLIAVQDAGRYKSLDSFARESMDAIYGAEHLPGLSPMASLCEWLFNRESYSDAPVIRLKDRGVRMHLSAHMGEAARRRIQETGYMTPRELEDPVVVQRIAELEPNAPMVTAMRRVRSAQLVAQVLDQMLRIVPSSEGEREDRWFTIGEVQGNLPPELLAKVGVGADDPHGLSGRKIPGISQAQATSVVTAWAGLWKGWTTGEAEQAQRSLDKLAALLPTLAAPGVYPAESQRAAEASYYAWGKFTWGCWLYLLGMLIAVLAVVTRWRTPWMASLVVLLIAMFVHAYGISLRWYILGRIPVANMFEAITASAWVGIAVALLVELRYKMRVALLAAHATGFFALMLAGYVVPGGGTISTIMGILDDVMLRIHTVMIISSYSLIFLAAVIAVVYLFGYYFHTAARKSCEIGAGAALFGAALWLISGVAFRADSTAFTGVSMNPTIAKGCLFAALASIVLLVFLVRSNGSVPAVSAVTGLLVISAVMAIGHEGFALGMSYVMLGGGLAWAAGNAVGLALAGRAGARDEPSRLAMAIAGGPVLGEARKPILAGALPGDRPTGGDAPTWLQQVDWCHLIILNMIFVILFVGVVLGAVWADYSWGRPWGWDPKEVFALNTWIVYAILIHLRFITKKKALWTAWCSVLGCLMMAFNWCFVNFYIVGLHSYA